METIERDYSVKGVKFYYIYKSLAHPEINGYVTPFTLEERLMHVAEAKKKIGSQINWICDSMSNDLKHALGDAPNSEFIVDPEGKLVRLRQWSRPEQLREDLIELIGEVETPTTIAQVNVKSLGRPKTAATGVVPRVKLAGRMMPVTIQPVAGLAAAGAAEEPYFVKLRAEVDSEFFQSGEGQLYLGFFLDPLYKVHWNNRAMPVEYEIEAPGDMTITPSLGKGPDVEEDSDADPREFLVDISGRTREPILLTVKYVACDDAETFCKPVTQRYEILLERDRDGGSRRTSGGGRRMAGRWGGPGGAGFMPNGFGPPGFRPGGFGPPQDARTRSRRPDPRAEKRGETLRSAVSLFRKYDASEDGTLDEQEWAKMDKSPAEADTNSDDLISLKELMDWLENVHQRGLRGST
ncbi:MAG: hypothetical protein ACC645_05745 [Pirellulales bacterium]